MKGILLLNGQPHRGDICADGAYVVCCDGAYDWAKGRVKIDENVGDFDSLSFLPDPPPTEIYPSEKNYTDGEIGLERLLARGCDEIDIYGGGGGREDHFLGNLHLLYRLHRAGVKGRLYARNSVIFPASGQTVLRGRAGETLSVLPFGGDAHIMQSEGFKYPLDGLTLTYGSCRGISNVLRSDRARFDCDRGTVLVFLDFDEEEKG